MNTFNISFQILRLVVTTALVAAISACSQNGANHVDAKRAIDVWNPDIKMPEYYRGSFEWISPSQLLVTALQDGAVDDMGAGLKLRVLLVDVLARKVTVVANDAEVIAFPQANHLSAVIGHVLDHTLDKIRDPHRPPVEILDVRQISIGSKGEIGKAVPLPDYRWQPDELTEEQKYSVPLGSAEDGRLVHKLADGRFSLSGQGCDPSDITTCTKWVRPGRSDLYLPIRLDEVSHPVKSLFLNKIILNSDSERANYILALNDAGGIEKLLALTDVSKSGIRDFDYYYPTAEGALFTKQIDLETKFYIFKNGVAAELLASGMLSNFPFKALDGGVVWRLAMSPDGCHAAFSRQHALFGGYRLSDAISINIASVCK